MIAVRSVTLAELARESGGLIQTGPFGSQLHASDYVDDGVPVIMPKNIGDGRVVPDEIARVSEKDAVRLARHRVQPGDIVYSRRGDVERHALIRDHEAGWLCGTGCLLVRIPGETAVPRYLSSFLRTETARSWIVAHAIGATMANLNTKILGELLIRLPPLPEQHAIAEVLGALDDKIELNERMNATLDEMARALFKSWFVDFDPVRAKAEGRRPPHMDAATAALFSASFEDSPLGPIPAGWRVADLESVATVTPGRSYKSAELADSKVALVTLKSIGRGGGYQPRGLKAYTGPYKEEQRLCPGDVVVAKTDLTQNAEVIGRVARVPREPEFETLVASLDLAIVRPVDETIPPGFLYESLRTQRFIDHALGFTNGTTVLHLGKDAVPTYPLLIPDARVFAALAERLEPTASLAENNVAESMTLAELRDTLLPRLISGEIRVGEAAGAVEVAV